MAGRYQICLLERRTAKNSNNNHASKVNDFPEAPASWNTKYVDPNGYKCQITLCGESGSELLEKAVSAIKYLIENSSTPYVYYHNSARQVEKKTDEVKKEKDQLETTKTILPSARSTSAR